MLTWRERKILTCFGAKGANPKTGSSYVMSPFSILLHTTQITQLSQNVNGCVLRVSKMSTQASVFQLSTPK